jgi:FeS assembly SUF system regulator
MLRISRIADYGVVLGTRLATLAYDDVRSVRDLARETGIPQPTVSKILKQLGRSGVVDSTRGARGGYRLARRAGDITVADIIAALEGPIGVTECGHPPAADDGCELAERCGVRGNWQRINHAIADALSGITLAEMAEPAPPLVSLRRGRAPHPASQPAPHSTSLPTASRADEQRGAP